MTDEQKEAMSPRWISIITAWLCSEEAKNVTGRVFDVKGNQLGIAEQWRLGPVVEQPDDPTDLGPLVAKLMAEAGNRIIRVMGVMNGTCNYILTRMENAGLAYEEVFEEARALAEQNVKAAAENAKAA